MGGSSADQGGPPGAPIPASELIARTGATAARVAQLTDLGLITPGPDGHDPGDVDRVRFLDAFEAAGVSVEVLAQAQADGALSLDTYPALHPTAPPPSTRTYAAWRSELGDPGGFVPSLFAALGVAEPAETSPLSTEAEELLAMLADIAARSEPDLVLRAARLFGDGARRVSDAALSVYHEGTERLGEVPWRPAGASYDRLFLPWTEFARLAPELMRWLLATHLSRAIDAYSVEQTELALMDSGRLPSRPERPPAVAFVDLSGYTRLAVDQGDDAAARTSLLLGELADAAASGEGGRMVKLLGDGALLRFPDASAALRAVRALLAALPASGLPPGHAGIDAGRIVTRDGDVFGRTVNTAARLSDLAGPGDILVTEELAAELPELPHPLEVVGPVHLQGIGDVQVVRVR